MSRLCTSCWLIVAVLLLGVLAAPAVFAADPKPAVPAFGVVDFEKVFLESNATKQRADDLHTIGKGMDDKLNLRAENSLLSDDEFKELADLQAKAKPNADESKRIANLKDLSKQREQEFAALQQKASPTDEDKARLRALQGQQTRVAGMLKRDQEAYQNELTSKRQEIVQLGTKEVQAATAAVAKEKGLSVVFNRATSQGVVVVYASVDITDDVIARINKPK